MIKKDEPPEGWSSEYLDWLREYVKKNSLKPTEFYINKDLWEWIINNREKF